MSRFFLDHPVFAWVIAIVMMLGGVLAIYNLPIAQYPPVAPPSISIRAVYPGASAETIENSVVQIIEQNMTGLDGMIYMQATSDASGSAQLTLTFAPGTDPDLAWAKVQNKLQLAMPMLPEVVQRTGLSVGKATRNYLLIVGLTSSDPTWTNNDLSDYLVSNVQNVLARVPGVGEVQAFGSGYAMRIWLDTDKLTKYGMTVADVVAGVKAYNVEVSAGQFGGAPAVPGQRLNASILVQSLLKTPEEFAAVPLRTNPDGSVVRVSDVGRAELGSELNDIVANYNGQPSTALAIRQVAGANALDVADGVKAAMKDLSKYFPKGMEVVYPYDTTPFVKVAIWEVVKTLIEAIVLVFLVMFLFLGNLRATLVPTIAVPVVLLGTFARPRAVRLLDQHADHVRDGAFDRPAGRRRHRGGRERRAPDERGRAVAARGDGEIDGPDPERAGGHRPRAGRGVRPDGVLPGLDRRHLPAVLDHGDRLDAALGAGRLDPLAGPVRRAAQAGREGARGGRDRLPDPQALLPLVRPLLLPDARRVRAGGRARPRPPPPLRGGVRGDRRRPGGALLAHADRLPSRGGPGHPARLGPDAGRLDARADRCRRQARAELLPRAGEEGGRVEHGHGRNGLRRPQPEPGDDLRQAPGLEAAQPVGAAGQVDRGPGDADARGNPRGEGVRVSAPRDPGAGVGHRL